jgi:hypothetical protein
MSLFHSAGVAAVAAVGLYGALQLYGFARDNDQQYHDAFHVMEIQANFAGLAKRLPVGTQVGYFSDMPQSETPGRAAFFATRYGAAPRLLVNSESPRYLVGVFSRSQYAPAVAAQRGLVIVQGLGSGFVLFEKKASE